MHKRNLRKVLAEQAALSASTQTILLGDKSRSPTPLRIASVPKIHISWGCDLYLENGLQQNNIGITGVATEDNGVVLPDRFVQLSTKLAAVKEGKPCSGRKYCNGLLQDEKKENRQIKEDMDTAISWLRQEMVRLRNQLFLPIMSRVCHPD